MSAKISIERRGSLRMPAGEWVYISTEEGELNNFEELCRSLIDSHRGSVAIMKLPSLPDGAPFYRLEVRGKLSVVSILALIEAFMDRNFDRVDEIITSM